MPKLVRNSWAWWRTYLSPSGLDIPQLQKAFQTASIRLRISVVSIREPQYH
jgi:hypothetical protein